MGAINAYMLAIFRVMRYNSQASGTTHVTIAVQSDALNLVSAAAHVFPITQFAIVVEASAHFLYTD